MTSDANFIKNIAIFSDFQNLFRKHSKTAWEKLPKPVFAGNPHLPHQKGH